MRGQSAVWGRCRLASWVPQLGAVSLTVSFLREGSPTKIDYRRKCTLIRTSLLEHLVKNSSHKWVQVLIVTQLSFPSPTF